MESVIVRVGRLLSVVGLCSSRQRNIQMYKVTINNKYSIDLCSLIFCTCITGFQQVQLAFTNIRT